MTAGLLAAGAVAAAAWLAVLLAPARPWDLRPVAEDEEPPPEPSRWPSVAVLVPARNESAYLPRTLPALLAQDYPGETRVVVVDDRSEDGTAEAAARPGVEVVRGAPLPEGWVGKVWALEQGARVAGAPDYLLRRSRRGSSSPARSPGRSRPPPSSRRCASSGCRRRGRSRCLSRELSTAQ